MIEGMATYTEKIIVEKQVEFAPEDVITLSEAARLLGLSPSAVGAHLRAGRWRWLVDPDEPNPVRANRVLKAEIWADLTGRRFSTDARVKKAKKQGK